LGVFAVYQFPGKLPAGSRIELLTVDLGDESRMDERDNYVKIERNLTFKALYIEHLGINHFNVMAIKYLAETGTLFLATKNFGLIIYDAFN
jgi:hypothetical protein